MSLLTAVRAANYNPRSYQCLQVLRNFAKATPVEAQGSYLEAKRAAKDRRRQLYQQRMDRRERLKTRRKDIPGAGEKRRIFRKFFIPKKVDEEFMNRKARQAGLGWNYDVAVILTRTNVVLPDPEDWEIEYDNLRTHLDQFGIDLPKPFADNPEPGTVALTNEELLAMLPEGFTPSPRITEADKAGIVKTVDRKLKTDIHLYVQQQGTWQFPTVRLQEDETLVEAAKRALKDQIGPEVEYWSISNAPCAVNMEATPEEEGRGIYGTKTFFMKLNYDEGRVNESTMKVDDYAWLDVEEIVSMAREESEEAAKFYNYLL